MNKVLLLSCFISLTAHAGTGGGISTPPGKAGIAILLAETLGPKGSHFRLAGSEPLLLEIEAEADASMISLLDSMTTINVSNDIGENRSYHVTDGEVMNQYRLTDRRQKIRSSR